MARRGEGKPARSRRGARSICIFLLVYAATKTQTRSYDSNRAACRTAYSRMSWALHTTEQPACAADGPFRAVAGHATAARLYDVTSTTSTRSGWAVGQPSCAGNCDLAVVALRQCNYLSGRTSRSQFPPQEGRRRGPCRGTSAAGAICPYCKGIIL